MDTLQLSIKEEILCQSSVCVSIRRKAAGHLKPN